MCGEDAGAKDDDWDGFLEETIQAPTSGPIPSDWPSTAAFASLLKAAGTRWDAANLRPSSVHGYLLPPAYECQEEEDVLGKVEQFASDWRRNLRNFNFDTQPHLAPSSRDNVKSFLETGFSNGSFPLKLTALLLKPNQIFGLHVHPTLEMECTLRGALGEVRLVGKDKPLQVPFCGPWPHNPDTQSLCGPNLNDTSVDDGVSPHYASLSSCAQWKKCESVTPGKYLLNEVGSMHKSFTEEEPFAGLVLWGGIHAKIQHEGINIEHSELLVMEK